jgi:phosphatidylserine decarboxylase
MTLPLVSSRRNAKVSGEIIVRVGLISEGTREADDIYSHLVMASNSGIRSVPADQSVGTTGPSEAFIDYGSSSESEAEAMEELDSDGDSSDNESGDDETTTTELEDDYLEVDTASGSIPVITTSAEPDDDSREQETVARSRPKRYLLPRRLRRSPSAVDTSTASDAGDEHPSPAIKPKKIRVRVRRKRRPDRTESTDSQDQQSQTKRKQRLRRKQKEDFAFQPELGMDIIGIVQMEVKGAHDLPRWKNSLGTGFDMDPFVIVSFGQRIFRTRVARHSLNPTWDEKLLFRVRQHESNFVTKLAIYDWDKLSANDFVGSSEIKISELIEAAPKPDAQSGLYGIDEDGQHAMKVFQLPLARNERPEDSRNLGKHPPILTIEAKFTPYDSLRQRFWRQLLTQYDTNDSGTLNNLELSSMLDSLGSTLTSKTIQGLFSQFGKKGDDGDELTVNEAIVALEKELSKPWAEKRYVDRSWEATPGGSGSQTPAMMDVVTNQLMGYVGPHAPLVGEGKLAENKAVVPASAIDEQEYSTDEKSAAPLSDDANLPEELNALSVGKQPKRHDSTKSTSTGSSNPSLSAVVPEAEGEEQEEQQVERVIVLKSCPLCHMPRLSKKAEMDIVTHLAVCASQDWRRVDSMVVNNFVTASQAHRKWYTKVITKISQGQYQLGAHSANIIVQDRMTGELLEEKMQVYVRLGMRLLYNAARSRMEGARVKKMLRNMSVKQGVKFDSPASAREIPQFIAFHNLSLHEIAEPIESFKTFNQFFYRKLKEGVRPISDPDDATTLVSSADCRLMAFSSITEATKVWIKGREFTVERLLGDKYKKGASRDGGSLVIFRLAPQDYHRFHCPANAVVVDITMIHGQYYTVNPMAIRSAIDVYGENIRAVVEFKSQEFGTFYCVCIGAMMVGSIHLSVRKGDTVKRGDEMGYYAFGGSTNVCM